MEGTLGSSDLNHRKIGRQIVLPLSRAFEIAWKGIRIRIWRSLITMSGIILAIAFLMSVWTADVFGQALRGVPSDQALYPLVRGALEATALESSGIRIGCIVLEEEGRAGLGQLSPGSTIRRLLNAQGRFQAELLPADDQAILDVLDPEQLAVPDAVIMVGFPAATAEEGVAEAIDRFVRGGGMLLVYASEGDAGPMAGLLPATAAGATFMAAGPTMARSDHLASTGVPWQAHPEAEFLATEGKPQASVLATSGGQAVAWVGDHGEGTVAWYPLTGESGRSPDVMSWFLRGCTITSGQEGDSNTSLLVKLLAHGCRRKLVGEAGGTRSSWLVTLSLLVCVVGITNAMLMSVTERFREIGTMKCLGALDKFVVKLFLIESSLQGVVGSLLGATIGFLLAFLRALFTFHVRDLDTGEGYWLAVQFFPLVGVMEWFILAVVVGAVLSVVAAVYPALRAARMEPVQAMRVEA